ncbi:MAG: release factor glutamine methyltransferase [Actinomycetota bacterium]|nr:release factor glutamine methyltransferase [Actinomycetota bacterium]
MLIDGVSRLTVPPERAARAVRRFADALDATGLDDILDCITPMDSSPASVERLGRELRRPLARALDLLVLGEAVAPDELPADLRRALDEVLEEPDGALLRTKPDGTWILTPLSLYRAFGFWYLAHSPHPASTAYFGDDSLALASRLDHRARSVLDLCAGPGIQSLRCAARGQRAVGVEINPAVAWMAQVNARVVGVEDLVEFRVGSLYAAVDETERFDLICANPPLLPIPVGFSYPFIGDGGPDGLTITRQVLEGARQHLTEHGLIQMLGMTLSDGFRPQCVPELEELADREKLQIGLIAVRHERAGQGSVWCDGVATTALAADGTPPGPELRIASDELAQGYLDLGASHVVYYFLTARPGEPEVRYHDLSQASRSIWTV